MNVFIVFVKFLDWIVVIWVRLARLIEEKGGLRFWKGPNYKNEKTKWTQEGLGLPWAPT